MHFLLYYYCIYCIHIFYIIRFLETFPKLINSTLNLICEDTVAKCRFKIELNQSNESELFSQKSPSNFSRNFAEFGITQNFIFIALTDGKILRVGLDFPFSALKEKGSEGAAATLIQTEIMELNWIEQKWTFKQSFANLRLMPLELCSNSNLDIKSTGNFKNPVDFKNQVEFQFGIFWKFDRDSEPIGSAEKVSFTPDILLAGDLDGMFILRNGT